MKTNMKKAGLALTVCVLSAQSFAATYQSYDLTSFMRELHQNPEVVMDQLPPKVEPIEITLNKPFAKLEDTTLQVVAKDNVRKGFCKVVDGTKQCLGTPNGRAAIEANDRAEDLYDSAREVCATETDPDARRSCYSKAKPVKTLREIDYQRLLSAKLETQPWSDDYWAIAKGILGARYNDPDKASTNDWLEAFEWAKENPVSNYVESNQLALLSPSEKYDLLVGDKDGTLTKAMWAEGKAYYDEYKSVELWMGICHGWAPAAYMLDRPTKAIEVLAADGKTVIPFYPADIKALGSLLWAKNQAPTKFIGGRCNTKDPKKENGRVVEQDCFDNNPGSWHLAVVNQIAKAKRSFVIDATFDYEVWNQPVVAYKYRYFNVNTYEQSYKSEDATVSLSDYAKDPFKKFRSDKAVKVVGVEMKLDYVVETRPSARTYDSPALDAVTSATYRYDLELDQYGNVVGGEWYSNAHPDFLWTPNKGSKALSRVDQWLTQNARGQKWEEGKAVPELFQKAATYASQQGAPLAAVVEELVRRSNN